MSWLSEITERAENILNTIDKNAAVALNKPTNTKNNKKYGKAYQNSLENSEKILNSEISETLVSSDNSTYLPFSENTLLESSGQSDSHTNASTLKSYINTECLQNEIHSLNNEISLLLTRVKISEQKSSDLSEKFSDVESKSNVLEEQLSNLVSLVHASNDILEVRKLLVGFPNNSLRKTESSEKNDNVFYEHYESQIQDLLKDKIDLEERLKTKEDEIIMLKSRLSQKTFSFQNDELQSRLRALTITLIQKQSSLESLTIEKNNLASKLNQLEGKYEEVLGILHQCRVNINHTDDVKAQIPIYRLDKSLQNTNLYYRFKKAYSIINALGFKSGVLHKKETLKKVFLFIYMIVMHILIFLLMNSRMPDATTV